MKLALLERAFKLSLSNLWRNKFLSLATVFVIGTIIFIFNVILAVNLITKDALSDLNKKIDIVIYLKESTDLVTSQEIVGTIQTFEGVEKVVYNSKEDALKQIKQTHPNISLAFEKYQLGNPLPASINITTSHPKYHEGINQTLSESQYQNFFSNIVTSSDSANNTIITSVAKNLLEVNNFANQVIFWLILIFTIGGALIILNAIQITIFNRKREIAVMKLVGASYSFIRLPFIIESIIYGILSVLLSFILLLGLSKSIEIQSTSLWDYYSVIKFQTIFLIELLATIILSILSATIALHEYLQKRLLED